jgi:hypothetical protein
VTGASEVQPGAPVGGPGKFYLLRDVRRGYRERVRQGVPGPPTAAAALIRNWPELQAERRPGGKP